jgi:hypothetical protein
MVGLLRIVVVRAGSFGRPAVGCCTLLAAGEEDPTRRFV